jgi:hypothetical protein
MPVLGADGITYRSSGAGSNYADSDIPAVSAQSSATYTHSSRPQSGFRDLRGSRPNSAAIAAQIEGFDADFAVSACSLNSITDEISLWHVARRMLTRFGMICISPWS